MMLVLTQGCFGRRRLAGWPCNGLTHELTRVSARGSRLAKIALPMSCPSGGLNSEARTAGMANENVLEFTDDNFESDVLQSDTPVVVDFWAEWCMPCRMIAPTIDEIAEEFQGRVRVGKMDIDANRNAAAKYVSAIPTVIVFKDGEVSKKFVGLTNKDAIAAAIEEATSQSDEAVS